MSQARSNIVPLRTKKAVEAEAAAWLTILGRETLSEADKQKFLAWRHANQQNKDAFEALSAFWGEMEVLKELDDIAQATPAEDAALMQPISRRKLAGLAASAALALCVGGTAYLLARNDGAIGKSYVTRVGEQKTIELADGSVMQLNTDSRAHVRYSRHLREIVLAHGEAHFDVAKAADRPFIVKTPRGDVRAVGTAFTVRTRGSEAFEVTVEEGRVAVAATVEDTSGPLSQEADSAPTLSLSAGQNAIIDKNRAAVAEIARSDLMRKLSWRQGLLAYSGETLAEVVADVSRYTDVDITISDPSLTQRQIGGYFRVGDLDALLDALEMTFGLKVQRLGPKKVTLSAAS